MSKPTFISEELEPIAALIMGRMWARVVWEREHGTPDTVLRECDAMWYAARAIGKLSVATGGDQGAVHFSLASSNNIRRCAGLIEQVTGVRPTEAT